MSSIEDDLAELAAAIEMGIDPFPPPREKRNWGKIALASFMIIMLISWVSKALMRFV